MALTITVPQLAAAIRFNADISAVPEPFDGILSRQHGVAESIIEDYATDDCPDDVKNEAAVLMVGYLFDAPPVSRSPQNAFRQSGAQALLSRWHEPEYETVSWQSSSD